MMLVSSLSRIQRLLHRFAIAVGSIVAFGIPGGIVWLDIDRERANLEFRAEVVAAQIGKFANIQGPTWPYSWHRLPEFAAIGDPGGDYAISITYNFRGRTLDGMTIGKELDGNRLGMTEPIIARGDVVGHVTIATSMQPILLNGLGVLAVSGLVGIALFALFNWLPMRIVTQSIGALARSEASLREEVLLKNEALQRIEVEAERAREANQVKSRFLAHMSHEMRTPLNAIIGFSDVMKSQMLGKLSPVYLGYARDINGSGVHLLDLVNALLDLAKIEQNKLDVSLAATSIPSVIEDAVKLVRSAALEKGIQIRVTVEDDVPDFVITDRAKVLQVLINLASNAVKYTPAGGRVSVHASRIDKRLLLIVSDTGVGMTGDEINIALEPFGQVDNPFTATQKGTGLGLPICREFISLLAGTMDVESNPGGGGTTVTISIPLLKAESDEPGLAVA